jgi:ribonuclease HI
MQVLSDYDIDIMNKLGIYIDGASKGNPGPAGIGVVIVNDERVIKNISSYIGKATNNIAEYTALIYALEEALILKAKSLEVKSDSQLLCCQINGEYKVKHPNLLPLYERAKHLIKAFNEFSIKYIPREENIGADKLATKAVKEALKK